MAEVGSLSARAKEAVKVFGKRIYTIFARNELFVRLIAKLTQYYIQFMPSKDALLTHEVLFLTQKAPFFDQRFPKSV